MRIGVVSDTHNNLKNVRTIVDLFNANNVDAVVHTGDITQAKTLDEFARLSAPLFGVFGNNDQERDALDEAIARHGFTFHEPPWEVRWADREIIVVHDPLELDGALSDKHELVLHGHTHLKRIDADANRLTFNPGECAGHMKGLNAIGIVELKTLAPEILNF